MATHGSRCGTDGSGRYEVASIDVGFQESVSTGGWVVR